MAHSTFRPPSTFTAQRRVVSGLRNEGGIVRRRRTQSCDTLCVSVGKGYGWKGSWMEGRVGRGRGGKTGLYTHVAKLPTEFIEGRGSGPSDDGKKKRWMDGMSLPLLSFFSLMHRRMAWCCASPPLPANALQISRSNPSFFRISEKRYVCGYRQYTRSQLLLQTALCLNERTVATQRACREKEKEEKMRFDPRYTLR